MLKRRMMLMRPTNWSSSPVRVMGESAASPSSLIQPSEPSTAQAGVTWYLARVSAPADFRPPSGLTAAGPAIPAGTPKYVSVINEVAADGYQGLVLSNGAASGPAPAVAAADQLAG